MLRFLVRHPPPLSRESRRGLASAVSPGVVGVVFDDQNAVLRLAGLQDRGASRSQFGAADLPLTRQFHRQFDAETRTSAYLAVNTQRPVHEFYKSACNCQAQPCTGLMTWFCNC
jgi:hypothetical protein